MVDYGQILLGILELGPMTANTLHSAATWDRSKVSRHLIDDAIWELLQSGKIRINSEGFYELV